MHIYVEIKLLGYFNLWLHDGTQEILNTGASQISDFRIGGLLLQPVLAFPKE